MSTVSSKSSQSSHSSASDKKLKAILSKRGYVESKKICDAIQGTIWRAVQQKTKLQVVIKITSKSLTSKSVVVINGEERPIYENILREKIILKYLTNGQQCPLSMVQYVDFMKSNINYYLIMTDGGHSLFNFNLKVHEYIESSKITISDWHYLVKLIFQQMLQCLEYIHSRNVCHFDISLENFLINDLDVQYNDDESVSFCVDGDGAVQIKLCDFGLAECFEGRGDDEKNAEIDFRCNKYCGKECYQSPEISNHKDGDYFDARMNDVWCLGVCLWMLITGSAPFQSSAKDDVYFKMMISGKMKPLLSKWGKLHYVDEQLLELFGMIFQYEKDRATIESIQSCKWLSDKQ